MNNDNPFNLLQFYKITAFQENPIITIFSDKSIVFFDQRKLSLKIHQISDNVSVNYVCTSHLYSNDGGKKLICLMDIKELLIYEFNEDYQLDSLDCKKFQNYKCVP
jgi:hypothetical protein